MLKCEAVPFSDIAPDVFDVEPDAIPVMGGHLVYKDKGFGDRKVTIDGIDTRRCYRFVLDDTVGHAAKVRIWTRPEWFDSNKPLLSELRPGVFDIIPETLHVECGSMLFERNKEGEKYPMSGLDIGRCCRLVITAEADNITRISVHMYPDYSQQEK